MILLFYFFYYVIFYQIYIESYNLKFLIRYTVQKIKKRNSIVDNQNFEGINLLSDTSAELIRSLLFIQSAIVQLHTGCVQFVHLYEAYGLYTLNGKWHTHVTKRWSIGWYNSHVTSYVMGDTGIANAHRVRNVCVHKSNR